MLASILLTILGLGLLAGLLFTLTTYALPVWVGMSAAFWLHDAEQSVLAAVLGGLAVGCGVAVLGEVVFAHLRSTALRLILGLVYAVPAALAGFHATKDLSQLTGTGEAATLVLAGIMSVVIGGTAFARIAGWSEAGGVSQGAESTWRVASER
jgi:hypothetical protein